MPMNPRTPTTMPMMRPTLGPPEGLLETSGVVVFEGVDGLGEAGGVGTES